MLSLRVGALAALWFSIHPMHVESVAWISARKDVLYGFFFLASCITYLDCLATQKPSYLAITFFLFVLSCLGKATAVPLPLVRLLLDWFTRRKPSLGMLIEKVPFLLVALVLGYLAVRIQAKEPIADFVHAGAAAPPRPYGLVTYWVKLFVPYKLSVF